MADWEVRMVQAGDRPAHDGSQSTRRRPACTAGTTAATPTHKLQRSSSVRAANGQDHTRVPGPASRDSDPHSTQPMLQEQVDHERALQAQEQRREGENRIKDAGHGNLFASDMIANTPAGSADGNRCNALKHTFYSCRRLARAAREDHGSARAFDAFERFIRFEDAGRSALQLG